MTVSMLISGGQTGADRAAFDAAMILDLKRGGMAPAGWCSEDGEIPVRYRIGMIESASSAYPVRTRSNVEASGGTLILSLGPLRHDSGSMLTAQIARTVGKPHLHVEVPAHHRERLSEVARDRVRAWLEDKGIRVLNVAGPRESKEPGVQRAACSALVAILRTDEDEGFGWDP